MWFIVSQKENEEMLDIASRMSLADDVMQGTCRIYSGLTWSTAF